MAEAKSKPDRQVNDPVSKKGSCGVVMPISEMDLYPEAHWTHVFDIIKEAGEAAGYETRIVSDSPEVGVIQRRIVQNLYNDDIVICDVSGKNPNVMLELGMRLAFDKPTIIIQDDLTKAPFDTSIIEYVEYPKTLHYYEILSFKAKLSSKITATMSKFASDKNFSTFLKHFGEFKPAEIGTKDVSQMEYLAKEIRNLREEFRSERSTRRISSRHEPIGVIIETSGLVPEEIDQFTDVLKTIIPDVILEQRGGRRLIHTIGPSLVTEEAIRFAADKTGLSTRLARTPSGFEFMPF